MSTEHWLNGHVLISNCLKLKIENCFQSIFWEKLEKDSKTKKSNFK